jgi:hypothetical protein
MPSDVRPVCGRRRQHGQRDGLHRGHEQATRRVREPADLPHRLQHAEHVGLGGDDARHRPRRIVEEARKRREVRGARFRPPGDERNLVEREVRPGEVGLQRLASVRMDPARHEHPLPARCPARHERRLRRGGGAVVVRGRDHVQAGQLGEQRLVLVDRLERPLADLGLVGRVGGVELAAKQDLVDHRGEVVTVDARSQEAGEVDAVVTRQGSQPGHELELREPRWEVHGAGADRLRDDLEELVDGADPERGEHPRPVVRGVRSVDHRISPPR